MIIKNKMKKFSVFCLPAVVMAGALLLFASCKKDNTTPDPAPEPTPELPTEYVDLDANGSANCYIVSKPGRYQFKPYKGNSKKDVGRVLKAKVLWESFGTATAPQPGDIINNDVQMAYSPFVITFSTPVVLKNGNAVIAALDENDKILWSWHIWVCADYDPIAKGQDYFHEAGKMMDRNLGATSVVPGDVCSLGLMYQWGRKDPFLGSSSISSSTTKVASTLAEWPSVDSNDAFGTIDYAIAHPTTFIAKNSANGDWYYTGGSTTDDDRWKSDKTIYDPCPPGWKIPADVWAEAAASSDPFDCTNKWDNTNKGANLGWKFGSYDSIWYPAAGALSSLDGSLSSVGKFGYWWSCNTNGVNASRLYLYGTSTEVMPVNYNQRGGGHSVRCIQEQVQ